jgi:tape measure domain-containing protein
MGTIANLAIKITGNVGDLKAALDSAERAVSSAGDKLQSLGDKMQGLGGKLTAGVSLPILGVGAAAIKAAADQEQLQIAFTTMLGSAERAKNLMAEINQFSALTPFQSDEVQESAKMLLAFGTEAEDVIDVLRRLGDLSAGVGAPLKELTYLYGTSRTQGRLFAADINQFTSRGIPIIQALADTMGVAQSEIRGMVEEGKVGFPELEKAIAKLTDQGGKFSGLMEAQSQSINGLFSTLKDNIELSAAEIGRVLIEQFDLKSKLSGLLEFTDTLKNSILDLAKTNPEMFRLGAIIAGAAAAAGPALVGLGMAAKFVGGALAALAPIIALVTSPIGLLIGAVALLGVAWATNFGGIQEATANLVAQLQPKIDEIKGWLEAQIPAALATAQAIWSNFTATASTAWTGFVDAVAPKVEEIRAWLEAQIPAALTTLQTAWDNFTAAAPTAWSNFTALTSTTGAEVVAFFGDLGNKANELQAAATPVLQTIGEFMAPAFERLATATVELPGKMAALQPNIEKLGGAFGNLMNAIQPILAALGVGLVVAANFGVNLVAAAFENLPGLLQPMIDTAINTVNLLADTVRGMVEVIKNIAKGDWAGAWEAFKGVIEGFKTYFSTTLENIKSFGATIFDTLKTAVLGTLTDLDSSAKTQMDALRGWWENAWSSLEKAFEPVKSGIQTVKDAVDGLKKAIEDFKNWIGGLSIPNPFAGIQLPALPALPTLPGFQLGTAYAHGGWSWVGENRRPELVFLPRGAQVVPWQEASKAAGGGGVNVTIQNATIRSEQDIWELAYRIRDLARREGW